MQALVDPAVVIIAMVVPALNSQLLPEILDHGIPRRVIRVDVTGLRCLACDIIIMSHSVTRTHCHNLLDLSATRGSNRQAPNRSGGFDGLAKTNQREMAERRNQTALDQLDVLGGGKPARVTRPAEFGGAEAEPAHDRLQAAFDDP